VQKALDPRHAAGWRAPCEKGGYRGNSITVTALLADVESAESARDAAKLAADAENPRKSAYLLCSKMQKSLYDVVHQIDARLDYLRVELAIEQSSLAGSIKGGLRGNQKTVEKLEITITAIELARDEAVAAADVAVDKGERLRLGGVASAHVSTLLELRHELAIEQSALAGSIKGGLKGGLRGNQKTIEKLEITITAIELARDEAVAAADVAGGEGERLRLSGVASAHASTLLELRHELGIEQSALAGNIKGGLRGNQKTVSKLEITITAIELARDDAVAAADVTVDEGERLRLGGVASAHASTLLELRHELGIEQSSLAGNIKGGLRGNQKTIEKLEITIAATELARDKAVAAADVVGGDAAETRRLEDTVRDVERQLWGLQAELKIEESAHAFKAAAGKAATLFNTGRCNDSLPGAVCLSATLKTKVDSVENNLSLRGTLGNTGRAEFWNKGPNVDFFIAIDELKRLNMVGHFGKASFSMLEEVMPRTVPPTWAPVRPPTNTKSARRKDVFEALALFKFTVVTTQEHLARCNQVAKLELAAKDRGRIRVGDVNTGDGGGGGGSKAKGEGEEAPTKPKDPPSHKRKASPGQHQHQQPKSADDERTPRPSKLLKVIPNPTPSTLNPKS
jgi:hypothetical protein